MNFLSFLFLTATVAKSSQLTCQSDFRRPGTVCSLFSDAFMLLFMKGIVFLIYSLYQGLILTSGPKCHLAVQCTASE